jgi:hypothetical protein
MPALGVAVDTSDDEALETRASGGETLLARAR